MFVDKVTISVSAGNGGDGAVAFHREKYVASGGPDGGDGGRGGDIVLIADDNMSTLMDFRYKRKYSAGNGENGDGKRCNGRSAEPMLIRVPRGTVIKDAAGGGVIADMSSCDSFVVAKGGRGGWGNSHFATPTRQTPRFAKPGMPGQKRSILLELKLLADVGLAGFPNVGKSTLLSVVSKAHPKIANYHFTTLYPNLGVVYAGDHSSFVMADIPGIIEGASEGAGLGYDFLRHIERCRLIVHLVDASGSEGRDPAADFEAINEELAKYSPELASRPQIVAANKCDLPCDAEKLAELRRKAEERGFGFFEISAAAHIGTAELVSAIAEALSKLPPVRVFEPTYVEPELSEFGPDTLTYSVSEDIYTVEGPWMERLLDSTNLSDLDGRNYFDRTLRASGIYDRLEEMGIQEGDTVSIYNWSFEYRK